MRSAVHHGKSVFGLCRLFTGGGLAGAAAELASDSDAEKDVVPPPTLAQRPSAAAAARKTRTKRARMMREAGEGDGAGCLNVEAQAQMWTGLTAPRLVKVLTAGAWRTWTWRQAPPLRALPWVA